MQAIATNESQKPGHSTAHGSQSKTTAIDRHNTCDIEAIRPSQSAIDTTASINKVRCAGMPNPASATYTSAASKPAAAPTFCAGSSNGKFTRVKKE